MQLYSYNNQVTNYQVTEDGRVFNINTQKWLKGSISKTGYRVYGLKIQGFKMDLLAHRMVAETYVPGKTEEKNCVNHKDGNKLNNNVENLEWVSKKENNQHAWDTGLREGKKEVYCFDLNKKLLCSFPSITECSQVMNISIKGLAENLNRETAFVLKGRYWRFSKEENFNAEPPIIKTGSTQKPVAKYTIDGKYLESYHSLTQAGIENHCNGQRIGMCANGKLKTYAGFTWKFI